MSALKEISRQSNIPEVRAFLDASRRHKEREERTKGYGAGLAGAGLIGLGMGATYLGDHSMTAEDRLKLDNLTGLASRMDSKVPGNAQNPEFAGSSSMFYDYVDRASQAAGAKVFGKPVEEVVKMVRKSPILRGTSFDITKSSPFDLEQTDDHYRDFAAGPLAAYIHQFQKHDESFGGSWGATKNYIDPNTDKGTANLKNMLDMADRIPGMGFSKSLLQGAYNRAREGVDPMVRPRLPDLASGGNDLLASVGNQTMRRQGGAPDTYHEFRGDLEKNYNEFLKEEGIAPDGNASSNIREISQKMPHGAEMDALRKFRGWVSAKDPKFSEQLTGVERKMSDGMAGPAKIYSTGGNIGARLLQDLPRAIGTAAIAGGLGLTGYWAYRKLRASIDKRRLDEKRRSAQKALKSDPISMKQKAASLEPYDVERLIPEGSNLLSDFFLMPGAQRRAGRATGLADSLGEETDYSVRYPKTHRLFAGTAGGLAGATLGGIGGGLLGGVFDDEGSHDSAVGGAAVGAAGGAGIGALAGALLDTAMRRRGILETKDKAVDSIAGGRSPSPAIGKGSLLASLASGVHQQGRADTSEMIAHGKRRFDGNPVMSGLQIAGMVGAPVQPISMIGSVMNYANSAGRIDGAKPTAVRNIS